MKISKLSGKWRIIFNVVESQDSNKKDSLQELLLKPMRNLSGFRSLDETDKWKWTIIFNTMELIILTEQTLLETFCWYWWATLSVFFEYNRRRKHSENFEIEIKVNDHHWHDGISRFWQERLSRKAFVDANRKFRVVFGVWLKSKGLSSSQGNYLRAESTPIDADPPWLLFRFANRKQGNWIPVSSSIDTLGSFERTLSEPVNA